MLVELHAPVDLVALLREPRHAFAAFAHDLPVRATVALKNVDIDKLPMQVVGLRAPFTGGHINAELEVDGPLGAPHVGGKWVATGLSKPGRIEELDVNGELDYQHRVVRVAADGHLGKQTVLAVRGQAVLDVPRALAGEPWRDGAVQLDVDVPATELAPLPGVPLFLEPIAGAVRAHGRLRGTFAEPLVDVRLDGDDLRSGPAELRRIAGTLAYRQARFILHADAAEPAGGTLRVAALIPTDPAEEADLDVTARGWDIRGMALADPQIGSLGGTLDGNWQLHGARRGSVPSAGGTMTLTTGAFALRGDPRLYHADTVSLSLAPGRVTVPRFALLTDGGVLEAQGTATLDGWRVRQLSLAADARHFVFSLGSLKATLNAHWALTAERTARQWESRIDLDDGQIDLPELVDGRNIQSLSPLADVHFADARAQKSARDAAGRHGQLDVRLTGPLRLRSDELSVDLGGDVTITLGRDLELHGTAQGGGGQFQLFGRRYLIDRLEAIFDGAPENPTLHARISRQVADAKLVLTIDGTAADPHVTLTSEPPIYDPTQLVGLVLEKGPAGGARLSLRDFDHRMVGIFSGTLLRHLRAQLAHALPVDIIRPDEGSYTALVDAPGEVGRFVSDRVYVQYQHHFGSQIGRSAENTDEAQVRYRFAKSYELDTVFGDQGVAGIFLYWTRRY